LRVPAPQVSDVGVLALARVATLLTSVTANDVPGITDAAVAALGKHCPDLQRLSLKRCTTVSDTSLKVRRVGV
jgi:hypothetical protein